MKRHDKEPDGNTSRLLEIPVVDKNIGSIGTSDNFRFTAAVAQMGMLLNDSPYKGSANSRK